MKTVVTSETNITSRCDITQGKMCNQINKFKYFKINHNTIWKMCDRDYEDNRASHSCISEGEKYLK